jgi:hypothetical protein
MTVMLIFDSASVYTSPADMMATNFVFWFSLQHCKTIQQKIQRKKYETTRIDPL